MNILSNTRSNKYRIAMWLTDRHYNIVYLYDGYLYLAWWMMLLTIFQNARDIWTLDMDLIFTFMTGRNLVRGLYRRTKQCCSMPGG